MSAEPERHLHLIDTESGEVYESCPGCSQREDEIAGLTSTIRSQAAKIVNLKRDKLAAAKNTPLWPVTKRVHDYWREKCKHPRSGFSLDVFETISPFVDDDGEELCRRAIDGAAYDPFITTRKNGSKKRHDGIDLIFRNRAKFEEFVNRAPRDG